MRTVKFLILLCLSINSYANNQINQAIRSYDKTVKTISDIYSSGELEDGNKYVIASASWGNNPNEEKFYPEEAFFLLRKEKSGYIVVSETRRVTGSDPSGSTVNNYEISNKTITISMHQRSSYSDQSNKIFKFKIRNRSFVLVGYDSLSFGNDNVRGESTGYYEERESYNLLTGKNILSRTIGSSIADSDEFKILNPKKKQIERTFKKVEIKFHGFDGDLKKNIDPACGVFTNKLNYVSCKTP